MNRTTRAALAGVPLSLALLLAGACSDDDGDSAGSTTTASTEATTTSSTTVSTEPETTASSETTAPPSSSETTAPPATEVPSTETTAPPEDGTEGEFGTSPAAQLVRAWGAGDRERALELATPRAVGALFGMYEPGGTDWELTGCDGAAGTLYCTFDSASKAMTLQVAQPNVPDESGNLPLIDRVEFLP